MCYILCTHVNCSNGDYYNDDDNNNDDVVDDDEPFLWTANIVNLFYLIRWFYFYCAKLFLILINSVWTVFYMVFFFIFQYFHNFIYKNTLNKNLMMI